MDAEEAYYIEKLEKKDEEISSLTKELQEAKIECERLQSLNDHWKPVYEDLVDSNDKLTDQIEQLQKEIAELTKELREAEQLYLQNTNAQSAQIAQLTFEKHSYKESFENCQSSLQSEKEKSQNYREIGNLALVYIDELKEENKRLYTPDEVFGILKQLRRECIDRYNEGLSPEAVGIAQFVSKPTITNSEERKEGNSYNS